MKVRGYRIELGEVENAIGSLDNVKQVKVVVSEDDFGEKELIAFYAGEEKEALTMVELVRDRIPTYMAPHRFVYLKEMPVTARGKIDKKALLQPELYGDSIGETYVAPENDLQERLVEMWSEVLSREKIGINDDFFLLGGNSLKVIRLVSMLSLIHI